MAYFNFERLIQKYSREFTLISETQGSYNDMGDWVSGEKTETRLSGAIMDFRESKIYRENSTLTANDKHLHMLYEIPDAWMGGHVIFGGRKYKIEEEQGNENADFTGVFSYVLKYVSAFDRKECDSVD